MCVLVVLTVFQLVFLVSNEIKQLSFPALAPEKPMPLGPRCASTYP
jgi:hypothetical protein